MILRGRSQRMCSIEWSRGQLRWRELSRYDPLLPLHVLYANHDPQGEHGVGLVKRDYLPHELGESTVDTMRKVSAKIYEKSL